MARLLKSTSTEPAPGDSYTLPNGIAAAVTNSISPAAILGLAKGSEGTPYIHTT